MSRKQGPYCHTYYSAELWQCPTDRYGSKIWVPPHQHSRKVMKNITRMDYHRVAAIFPPFPAIMLSPDCCCLPPLCLSTGTYFILKSLLYMTALQQSYGSLYIRAKVSPVTAYRERCLLGKTRIWSAISRWYAATHVRMAQWKRQGGWKWPNEHVTGPYPRSTRKSKKRDTADSSLSVHSGRGDHARIKIWANYSKFAPKRMGFYVQVLKAPIRVEFSIFLHP